MESFRKKILLALGNELEISNLTDELTYEIYYNLLFNKSSQDLLKSFDSETVSKEMFILSCFLICLQYKSIQKDKNDFFTFKSELLNKAIKITNIAEIELDNKDLSNIENKFHHYNFYIRRSKNTIDYNYLIQEIIRDMFLFDDVFLDNSEDNIYTANEKLNDFLFSLTSSSSKHIFEFTDRQIKKEYICFKKNNKIFNMLYPIINANPEKMFLTEEMSIKIFSFVCMEKYSKDFSNNSCKIEFLCLGAALSSIFFQAQSETEQEQKDFDEELVELFIKFIDSFYDIHNNFKNIFLERFNYYKSLSSNFSDTYDLDYVFERFYQINEIARQNDIIISNDNIYSFIKNYLCDYSGEIHINPYIKKETSKLLSDLIFEVQKKIYSYNFDEALKNIRFYKKCGNYLGVFEINNKNKPGKYIFNPINENEKSGVIIYRRFKKFGMQYRFDKQIILRLHKKDKVEYFNCKEPHRKN